MVDVYFVTLLILEMFLYTFHLSMLILLFCQSHTTFKGPFYNVFRIVIVGDFLNYLAVLCATKLSMITYFSKFYVDATLFPTILQNFSAYIAYLQFFGHTFMAINRFTFIYFPFIYKNMWKRHWYTFLIMFLPFLCCCWKLHEPATFIFLADKSTTLRLINPAISQTHFTVSTTIYIITTCVVAVLNLLSFIKFYLYKKNVSSIQINEKSLLIVSFIVFLAQVLRTSYNLLRLLFPTNDSVMIIAATLLPIISDVFSLSGSVSLLILSKTTRKVYKIFYFGEECFLKLPTTISPTSHPNNLIRIA